LWESALDLFKAADKYSLQSLKVFNLSILSNLPPISHKLQKSCEEALSSTVGDAITVANVCEVLVTGEMYSSGVLKRAAVGFIRRNGNAVMLTAAWRQLMRDQPRLVDYVLATVLGIPPPKPGDYKDENGERVELTIIQ
jgi:hypothetical protein